MDEKIKVAVEHGPGPNGLGWYVLEKEYQDEGYVYFSETRPSADELRAICPEYVEG